MKKIRKGDQVEVTGSQITFDGKPALIAQVVKKGEVPAALARQLRVTGTLPAALEKKVEPLPAPPNYARRGSVGPGSGAVPVSIPTANSPLRRTLGNQAAMAARIASRVRPHWSRNRLRP